MKTILLRYNGWLVIHDSKGWPSDNYIVFKEPEGTKWDTTQRIPKVGAAYCDNIQSALVHLFQQSIIKNARKDGYNATLKGLTNLIIRTRMEFTDFFTLRLRKEIEKLRKKLGNR